MANSTPSSVIFSLADARNGNAESLPRLLSYYRPYVKLLARLWRADHLQAKIDDSDLVQETLMNAFDRFSQFRGATEAEFLGWMRSIMSNVTNNVGRFYNTQQRDVGRELKTTDFDQSSMALSELLADDTPSPSERVLMRERAVVVARALDKLPPDYREVLILRELESLPLREIAGRFNCSINGAKQLWVRAVMQMRKIMKQYNE